MSSLAILAAVFSLGSIYLATNVLRQLSRNLKAMRFFQGRAQNLVVLPKPTLFFGHALRTIWNPKNYQLCHDLHQKYGKTFGFYYCALPWVMTADIDLIKLVMLDQGDKHIDRLPMNGPYKEINHSIIQVNGDAWRAARRAIAPSMTNYKIRGELVTADIEQIVEKMRKLLSKLYVKHQNDREEFVIDSFHMVKRYALAVIVLVTYKRNDVVDFDSERDKWVDDLDDITPAAANVLCLLAIAFPIFQHLNYYLIKFHRVSRQFKIIFDFINQAIDSTIKSGQQQATTKQQLNSSNSGGHNKSIEAVKRSLADEVIETYLAKKLGVDGLRGTLLIFFLAGYETTAASINHLIWQLAHHPEIQEKLRADILSGGFDSDYLQWCILESMRFHPPIPLGVGRVLSEDINHKGTVIPKGTNVAPTIYSVHHDADLWPEPEKFKPERWAQVSKSELHPAAYLAFGLGPRNCVGGKLAMHEIKLFFQMLLTDYRIEKCSRTPNEYNFSSPATLTTQVDEPTIVRLVPLAS